MLRWLSFIAALGLATPSASASGLDAVLLKWWLLPGAVLGTTLGNERSTVLGLELSVARVDRGEWLGAYVEWLGAYVDCVHELERAQWRVSIGPEVGAAVFGLDGGPLLGLDQDGTQLGLTIRVVITFGVLALFARYGKFAINGSDEHGELGVLLKLPFDVAPLERPH